jgi:hypothetical protein
MPKISNILGAEGEVLFSCETQKQILNLEKSLAVHDLIRYWRLSSNQPCLADILDHSLRSAFQI